MVDGFDLIVYNVKACKFSTCIICIVVLRRANMFQLDFDAGWAKNYYKEVE